LYVEILLTNQVFVPREHSCINGLAQERKINHVEEITALYYTLKIQ